MKYYPNNTTANYITHLPTAIQLSGGAEEWEMALVEAHYPCSFETRKVHLYFYTTPKDAALYVGNDVQRITVAMGGMKVTQMKVEFPPGDYKDTKDFIDGINRLSVLIAFGINFKWDSKNETVEAIVKTTRSVIDLRLSPSLALQLGYPPDVNLSTKPHATRKANINLGFPSQMYVYCDAVEPQFVGDTVAPLLKIINIDITDYAYGARKTVHINTPHYLPILKSTFETVEIDLRDDTGHLLPFQFGTTYVKVHLRHRERHQ